jgi:NTP pyrophosphatase (non-canonical NTP hydrolase)
MNAKDQLNLALDLTPSGLVAKAQRNVPSYKTIAENMAGEIIDLKIEIGVLKSSGIMDEFQRAAWSFQLPASTNTEYLGLGLAGETGEVLSLLAKAKRDGVPGAILVDLNMAKELGDILWFVAGLATFHGLKLSDIAAGNITKLTDRKERGVLGGSGDNR